VDFEKQEGWIFETGRMEFENRKGGNREGVIRMDWNRKEKKGSCHVPSITNYITCAAEVHLPD
jgi:hypothetical protein